MAFNHSKATSAAANAHRRSYGFVDNQLSAIFKTAAVGYQWVVGFACGSNTVWRLTHIPTTLGCSRIAVPLVVRVYSCPVPFQRHVQPAGKSRGGLGSKVAWVEVVHRARYQGRLAMTIVGVLSAETRQGSEVRPTCLQFARGKRPRKVLL